MKPIPDNLRSDEIFHFLTLAFNIRKAKDMITKDRISTMMPKKQMALPLVNINKEYAMTTDLSKPLIFTEIITKDGNEYVILIDGYHRLYKALELNKKIKYVLFTKDEMKKFEMKISEVRELHKNSKELKNEVLLKDD